MSALYVRDTNGQIVPVPTINGKDGGYYTPTITDSCDLSWVPSDANMPEVASVNIKGPQGETGATGKDGISVTHNWNGTTLTVVSASGSSSANLKGPKGDTGDTGPKGSPGYSPVKGTDYWTSADKDEMVNQVEVLLASKDIPVFDTFPTEAQINALASNVRYFRTKGFHAVNDGLDCIYQVSTNSTKQSPFISHGNKSFCPANVTGDNRDIIMDYYGVRRYYGTTYAAKNSEIMSKLVDDLPNGYTIIFGSGHYYFADPIVCANHTIIRGASTNASVTVEEVNYGTYLHFTELSDGESAISLKGGVVQDIGIVGNPNICNVTLDRNVSITNRDAVVNEVNNGTTYGILMTAGWGYTIQNVRVRNCTYGIYAPTANALVTHVDIRNCKIGVSVGNDTKINNVQVWNVMTGVQLRGPLASAVNIRGDSVGKHLVECWRGKCMLSNIDGDYCVGSLIHYGDGEQRFIHLGQADLCMGRVATRLAYARNSTFDLRNISNADYEYCSYISIAPNTQVFGGHIEMTNVKANIFDVSSEYIHPDAAISIGPGSTVKGVTIKCNVPYNVDLEYFNSNVIKSLSNHNQSTNDDVSYETDFDGNVIEDINFITPIGFIRSKRTTANVDRVLEFSKDPNGVVLYDEQNLNEAQKIQARKNIGLDNMTSLEFVASMDDCTNTSKVYVLPDGRTVAGSVKVTEYYKNQLPISVDATEAVYNAAETPGYKLAYFSSDDGEAIPTTTNWYLTGYIPAQIGDILRFENMEVMDMNGTSNSKTILKFYDENFKFVVSSSNYYPGSLPSNAWSALYNDTGNICQVKIPTSYSTSIRYVRLCAKNINPNSIITVNQEIREPDITSFFGDTGLRFITEEIYNKLIALLE